MSVTTTTRNTNGVSYGYKHTITAAEATDGTIIIDFQVDFPLAAVVQYRNASGTSQATTGFVITYPANGQVSIAEGGGNNFTAGELLDIVAARDSQPLTF